MVSNISERDIISVANRINISLDNSQINRIWHLFQHEEECNISKDWEYIVQDCILQVITA